MNLRLIPYRLSVSIILSSASVLSSNAAAPTGWHKQLNDSLQGINLNAAVSYLKANKLTPQSEIVVGIIDSGIDTTLVDLAPALWTNPGERRDGKDTDGNGYADDLHGWNFLGTADGSFNMTSAGTEEFREFKRLHPIYKDADSTTVANRAEYEYYRLMRRKAGINSYIMMTSYTEAKSDCYRTLDSIARAAYPEKIDTISISSFLQILPDEEIVVNSIQSLLTDIMRADGNSSWTQLYKTHLDNLALMKRRVESIEKDPDKRLLMGDNLKDATDIYYGNPCLNVEGCDHGTFVAGVIAGQGIGSEPECSGIYPDARLMILRASPDGDEYDKDVATAIRYAVDNGAKIINISLGKTCSPDSAMVSDAVAYAHEHDVLILQAAGNSKTDIDNTPYFPTGRDRNGKKFDNYLRVGASDVNGQPYQMTNYGQREVDIFAPGVDIRSNTLDNKYMNADGTSIACPVASGVAALLRAYFPSLKARQIKEILAKSCRKNDAFTPLCQSGGIVDVYEAVKLANQHK